MTIDRAHVPSTQDLFVGAELGRHLALAPVAFAVTEGRNHTLVYANSRFRQLKAAQEVHIGGRAAHDMRTRAGDLKPLLDEAFRSDRTVRDALLEPPAASPARWSCTIWPVSDSTAASKRLVVEVRDVGLVEGAKRRQRAIVEHLVLGALREQDVAEHAVVTSERAQYLAATSRELSLSLDEATTLDTLRHLTLPRPGTWCIVDVIESNGALHRLAVIHPDPTKQALARQFERQWPSSAHSTAAEEVLSMKRPTVLSSDSGDALVRAAHDEQHLRILQEIGFGWLLIVPLTVRARVNGAITFVSREGDPPFTADEISLAEDLAARCAMALDNARLYHEADALRIAAELANQSKSQFLQTVSHELRTPLNAIAGFTDLLESGVEGPVSEKQRHALARISANERHLLTLIEEILNFVRIESGRMEYRIGNVSLAEAVADVIAMLGGMAKAKGIMLTSASCDPDVAACADPERVRQILINLVMNAVKYTPTGGTVTLSCASRGDVVIAQVTDTGPGIPADRLDSIFDPFVQLSAGLSDRRGGVGLGLSISRDLARAMKGDLELQSEVGVGSSFTLTVPRAGKACDLAGLS